MSQLERALRRLDGAVTRLEATMGDGVGAVAGAVAGEVAALGAERDRLAEEVERLRAQAAEDARLRAEAARAVRSALHDLRGAVGQGEA
jgi:phage host-nuclease inhibitor protein Gam